MRACNIHDERTESDIVTAVELQKTKRILYFSDGIMEELSESEEEDVGPDVIDTGVNESINMQEIPLATRLVYKVHQIGCHFLSGVEYLGESLASFFGITSPKYLTTFDIENIKNDVEQSEEIDRDKYGHPGDWHYNNNNCTNAITTIPRNSANRIS